MENLNEEAGEASEECEDTKLEYEGSSQDEDVDIYEDLDVSEEVSEMNRNNIFSASPQALCDLLLTPSKSNLAQGKLVRSLEKHALSDDDVDLYEDLDAFQNQIASKELQEKVDFLTKKCSSLDKENLELKAELEQVKKQNYAFKVNISSIYKTAKLELGRKDRQLKELQRQHDSLVFRRGNNSKNKVAANNNNTELSTDIQSAKEPTSAVQTRSLEDDTEHEFRIGNNTISFVVESHPFQEARFRRLESLASSILRDEQQLEKNNQRKETRARETRTRETTAGAAAGEEGEIIDDKESSVSKNSSRSDNCKETSIEKKDRPSYNRSANERHRSRSPTAKRKRSPSIERRYLRSHPSTRDNSRSSTLRKSPQKRPLSSPQKRDARYKISRSSRSRRSDRH